MLIESDEPARIERSGIAASAAPVVEGLLGVEAVLRQVLTLSLVDILVMVVVDLKFRVCVLLGRFLRRF